MLLECRKLVERATRWLVRSRPRPLPIRPEIERFAPGAAHLAETLQGVLHGADRTAFEQATARYVRAGVPDELAARVAGLGALFSTLDIVEVAGATGAPLEEVAAVYHAIGARLSSSGSATRSRRCRATTAGRPSPGPRFATSCMRFTAPLPARRSRPARRGSTRRRGSEAWHAQNRAAVDRALQVLSDIRMGGLSSLETLSVALREVRNLIQSSGRVAPPVAELPPEAVSEPLALPPESLRLG